MIENLCLEPHFVESFRPPANFHALKDFINQVLCCVGHLGYFTLTLNLLIRLCYQPCASSAKMTYSRAHCISAHRNRYPGSSAKIPPSKINTLLIFLCLRYNHASSWAILQWQSLLRMPQDRCPPAARCPLHLRGQTWDC